MATDDIGGIQYQRIKNTFGADGTATDVSAVNPMPTIDLGNGLVSTVNSSTLVLAGGAAFTGTSEDVTEYASIVVSVFASSLSAVDGLSVQQSSDGTNWDHADVFSIPATTGKTFSSPVQGKFVRVVYTNGATLLTAFRLQTIYHKQAKKGSTIRPQDARSNDNDMEETLAHQMLFNGATWDRARGSTATGLLTEVSRINELRSTTLWVTATAASAAAATASLPAAGAGLFHYITAIDMQLYATGARTGAAAPVIVTSTNLPGSPAWNFPTAGAIGAIDRYDVLLLTPLKSSVANTISTIAAPIATAGLWRLNVGYFTGP